MKLWFKQKSISKRLKPLKLSEVSNQRELTDYVINELKMLRGSMKEDSRKLKIKISELKKRGLNNNVNE